MYSINDRVMTPDGEGTVTRVGGNNVGVTLDSNGVEYFYNTSEVYLIDY